MRKLKWTMIITDLLLILLGVAFVAKPELMESTMSKNELVLKDPAPFASPLEGVPGGLSYTARAWAKSENYWDVYFDLMKAIPAALGEAGFGGPAPTTNVNVHQ